MIQSLLSENGLSLDRMKNFVLVAESGSIRSVSEGDPAKQSLISRQIRELETFFGTELTRRKGRGLEITEAGLDLARRIRLQLQSLHDFKYEQVRSSLEVRIASGNSVLEWLVIPGLARDAKQTTHYRWSYHAMRTRDVSAALLDHRLDFGVIRQNQVVRPLKSIRLLRIGYAMFIPNEWRNSSVEEILSKKPWAITVGGEFHRQLASSASKVRLALRPSHSCTSFTQAAQLVRTGLAAAVLPEIAHKFLAKSAHQIPIPWLEGYARNLALVWHPRNLEVRSKLESVRQSLVKLLGQ